MKTRLRRLNSQALKKDKQESTEKLHQWYQATVLIKAGTLFQVHESTHNFPGFVELIYMVVRPEMQRQGLGSKVIQSLKDYICSLTLVQSDKPIDYIFTYADNSAVRFFEK